MKRLFKAVLFFVCLTNLAMAGDYVKAENNYNAGKYVEALKNLKGLNSLKSNTLKGRIYYNLYNKDSVYFYLMPVYRNKLTDDTSLVMLANAFLWDKDGKNAQFVLNRVKDKRSLFFRVTMSDALLLVGDYKKLINYYNLSIANGEYVELMKLYKARALKMLKKFNKADKILNKLIETTSDKDIKKGAYFERAELEVWQKNIKKGLFYVNEGLKIDKSNIKLLLFKGKILEWEGDFVYAKKIYSLLLNYHPKNKEGKNRLEKLSWVN